LALADGVLTPFLGEAAVRLGTLLPFGQAADAVRFFTGTSVSASAVRRRTEAAGRRLEAWERDEVSRLEREAPEAPVPEGARLQVSVDGAMVPLVGGEWTEVKTLAIGVVTPGRSAEGAREAIATSLSYFSRSCEADAFTRLSLVETHARGVERADEVVAVADGAAWIQGFVDHHRPEAIRILDFAHAAESVAESAKAAYGEGTRAATDWFERQRHRLRHEEPKRVIEALTRARRRAAARGREHAEVVAGTLGYLEARREQIRYAEFVASGYPIGSGAVESANKVVVERRMKGAGMHWARPNVNAVLALRCAVANERWQVGWQRVTAQEASERERRREARASRRRTEREMAPVAPAPSPMPAPEMKPPRPPTRPKRTSRANPPTHPWKVAFSRRRRIEQAAQARRAKL
jgi:hypothetical protein